MTTPTPIETFEDILAALENNPQLQTALRQHILDQEFLQLPAIVRELQQALAQLTQLIHDYITATDARLVQIEARLEQMEARLERIEDDIAELKAGQARLHGDVAELKTGQARLEGNVNRLVGTDYERKAARRASRLASRYLSMQDMRVIYAVTIPDNNQLPEILDAAIRAGRIGASEADELEEIDIVMQGNGEFAVAEVSVTLDADDVQRALSRGKILSKATTETVRSTVIGARALDSATQFAGESDVGIMILRE